MRTTLVLITLAGCVGQPVEENPTDAGVPEPDAPTCDLTRSYTGFGSRKLEETRPVLEAGADRMRLKPFSALATEYARALGLSAFDTAAFAATFGRPPARWFAEPTASANTVYAAFALAYDACVRQTATDATYAAAPTPTDATLICHDYVRRAWHRDATAEETAACVTYAIDKTTTAADPRHRWAYTCAAVLSASGFLTY